MRRSTLSAAGRVSARSGSPAMGPGDFAYIDVASGVDTDTVWRNELAGCLAFRLVAQACQDIAFGIIEADAWANAVGWRIGGDGHAEFAHVGDLCRLVDIQP